jgi:hypothetical protein
VSQPSGWRVRISPEVEAIIVEAGGRHGTSAELIRDFRHAMRRLAWNGTRASGAKKLRSLDLWEIRVGDHRAYFSLVPGNNVLAVGALVVKRTRRHRAQQLKTIERRVLRWRGALEEET